MEWFKVIIDSLSSIIKIPLWLLGGLALTGVAILYLPVLPGFDITPIRVKFALWITLGVLISTILFFASVISKLSLWAFTRLNNKQAPLISITLDPQINNAFWGASEQADGSLITQLSLRIYIHNKTSQGVLFRSVRLISPHVNLSEVVQTMFTVGARASDGSEIHSTQHPVLPGGNASGSILIMTRKKLNHAGRFLNVVIGATDQNGFEHRIRAKLWPMPQANTN